VIYASTRPFDDPSLLLQLSWEPGVPHVKINLYQEGTAADGTTSLKLVDTTTSSSWDDYAQGFRSDGIPNMNCPGQDPTSPFFATLQDSTQNLDPNRTPLPNHAQFKCYDGWSQLNQVQPARTTACTSSRASRRSTPYQVGPRAQLHGLRGEPG